MRNSVLLSSVLIFLAPEETLKLPHIFQIQFSFYFKTCTHPVILTLRSFDNTEEILKDRVSSVFLVCKEF